MKRFFLLATLAIIISSLLPKNIYARSGCCSHHGGVCGCGCCDGTSLSATCAPYYPECSRPTPFAPTPTRTPVIYTPTPSTPKPTPFPTPLPTPIPTVKPTTSPSLEPEIQSATTENTPIPIVQSEKREASSRDVLTGFGILAGIVGGLIWIIRKIIKKFVARWKQHC